MHDPESTMAPSYSFTVAMIWPVFSSMTALHARSFCVPWIINRPFVRCTLAMGDVRAPSTELMTFCGTLILTNGGTSASSAELRSQSPLRAQSVTEVIAHNTGTDPSREAPRASDGNVTEPATRQARNARVRMMVSWAYLTV